MKIQIPISTWTIQQIALAILRIDDHSDQKNYFSPSVTFEPAYCFSIS